MASGPQSTSHLKKRREAFSFLASSRVRPQPGGPRPSTCATVSWFRCRF